MEKKDYRIKDGIERFVYDEWNIVFNEKNKDYTAMFKITIETEYNNKGNNKVFRLLKSNNTSLPKETRDLFVDNIGEYDIIITNNNNLNLNAQPKIKTSLATIITSIIKDGEKKERFKKRINEELQLLVNKLFKDVYRKTLEEIKKNPNPYIPNQNKITGFNYKVLEKKIKLRIENGQVGRSGDEEELYLIIEGGIKTTGFSYHNKSRISSEKDDSITNFVLKQMLERRK